MSSEIEQELAKMEAAASILMGENSDVNQRKEANDYFVNLKEASLDPNVCRMVIENTSNPFVMFQMTQCLATSVCKNWSALPKDNLLEICKYLFQLPVQRPNLTSYVVAEVLKAGSILLKRGIVDVNSWEVDFVLEFVRTLLENADENFQSLGLRVVEAIANEFSTMWRTKLNISFDVHHKAKRRFEESLLKQFMQMSLSALSRIISSPDPVNENVCDRFLKVAVIVLQWNFTTSIKTAFLRVSLYSMNTAVALRPPTSWSDLFTNEELLPFFFGLHKKVRHRSLLAENSLSCLTQLAAVMGSALEPKVIGPRVAGQPQPHDLYVQRFCSNLMETFQDCFPYEVLSFSTALHRIFSHHPMPIFKRFPEEMSRNFLKFIVYWSVQLASPAMSEKKSEESVLVEAYTHVLSCWSSLLRSGLTFPKPIQELIFAENNTVIEAFLKASLAPPFGSRTASDDYDDIDDDDDDYDDTQYYGIILNHVGFFCRLSIDCFTGFVINVLHERIQQRQVVASGTVADADRTLWLEDMQWTLLMIGSFFQDADRDICIWLDKAYSNKQYVLVDMPGFILQCLNNDEFRPPDNVDPISIIVGLVCNWFGVVLRSLETEGANSKIVSPELYRTSFMTFSVLINFLTNLMDENPSQFFDDTPSMSSPMPTLPSNGEFSAQLIAVIIKHVFTAFKVFPSEEKLCNAAVSLILQESEKRAEMIAKCPLLYELISTITLERLPARRTFMTCLVTIGSNVNSTREREQMNNMILKPMAERFVIATNQYMMGDSSGIPHIVDLLECFSGIARAAQYESGTILYTFLYPLLQISCKMLRGTRDAQNLVDAILDLFHQVASTVAVFMDMNNSNNEQENSFFALLIDLIDNFKESQITRFNKASVFAEMEQEDQIADLVTLLKTVSNAVSKPYVTYSGGDDIADHLSFPLCNKILDMMLPLMCEDCLQLPTFSAAFFRLLLHVCESSPALLLDLPEHHINQLFYCFSWALDGASSIELTRLTLECLFIITKLLSNTTDTANGPLAVKLFNDLLAKTFEMAVHSAAEVDIHVSAIKAVFGFICLNKNMFMEYVQALVSRPENAAKQDIAIKAFTDLIPNEGYSNSRQEYKLYSERFEKFLGATDNIVI